MSGEEVVRVAVGDRACAPSGPSQQAVLGKAASPIARTPQDMDDPTAAFWCAMRLSGKQVSALGFASQGIKERFSEYGVAGATLASLTDFKRGVRGILPPLMLLRRDRHWFDDATIWEITPFGEAVFEQFKAMGSAA